MTRCRPGAIAFALASARNTIIPEHIIVFVIYSLGVTLAGNSQAMRRETSLPQNCCCSSRIKSAARIAKRVGLNLDPSARPLRTSTSSPSPMSGCKTRMRIFLEFSFNRSHSFPVIPFSCTILLRVFSQLFVLVCSFWYAATVGSRFARTPRRRYTDISSD